MKRCGIFIFFNEQGVVERYITVLLKSLEEVIDKLIIIINGSILPGEKTKLYNYSKDIYQRENIGFDGGAYKDLFMYLLNNEELAQWDEILLFNDTFYGPFFPWCSTFSIMRKRTCDFWGLSSHLGGREEFLGGEIVSPHVQSYFIVIKRRMFLQPMFYKFWSDLKYPKDYINAVKHFEIYFTEYFIKLGFRYDSWIEVQKENMDKNCLKNSYSIESQVSKLHFPIIKRKMCMIQLYKDLKKTFHYIDINTNYPLKVIYEDINQRCISGKMGPYNPKHVKIFCDKYSEIYLFGKGKYAENIEQYLIDNGIIICGYIVSKVDKKESRLYELGEFEVKSWQGIIVALNQKNLKEVTEVIQKKIPSEQVFFPNYS